MATAPTSLVRRVPLLQPDDLIPDQTIASAEEDAFRHHSLAEVVADVIRATEAPGHKGALNIGLFGAWGAGKSSFFELLRAELTSELSAGNLKLVRYDAWRYQGSALERHFIDQVANDLNVDPPDLYSAQERRRLDPQRLSWEQAKRLVAWVFSWVLPVLGVGVVLFLGWSALFAHVSHVSFESELRKVPKYVLAPATFLALLAAAARLLFTDLLVTERRERPAEEELGQLFDEVLESAKTPALPSAGMWVRVRRLLSLARVRALSYSTPSERRFVFFIDELDRCSRTEVWETLSAIKNFLGRDDCVFIVAADRDVLEEALTELPQANPTNQEAPYYSSASEFLDKIFQTQIAFPPLREQRRTRYARDLVVEKKQGLWADLRESDQGRALDDVIYVLIPGHVQSPRRIKVLLNNFAVNARRCQARELPWLARATEIAKLTVFETEFPALARDLPSEPRLPDLLLEEPLPDDLSPRTLALLKRHALPASEVGPASATTGRAQSTETDKILVKEDEARDRLAHAQRTQLRRYLESRRDFENPRRDLLYLESIGAVVDLDDPTLADLLETQGPEQPEKLLAAVAGRDQETIEKAVRVLASLVLPNFGRERLYVTHSLMGCVAFLDERSATLDAAVADALWVFLSPGQEQLDQDYLVLALDVALAAQRTALVQLILRDERLLAASDQVGELASRLDRLPVSLREPIESKVVEFFTTDQAVLFVPLERLPERAAVDFLRNTFEDTIAEFVPTATAEEVQQMASRLFQSLDSDAPRAFLTVTALHLLLGLGSAAVYPAISESAPRVLALRDNQQTATRDALRILAQAPPPDWEQWLAFAERYVPFKSGGSSLGSCGADAVAHIFDTFDDASEEVQESVDDLVVRTQYIAPIEGDDSVEKVGEALRRAAAVRAWATDSGYADAQQRLHRAAWELKDEGPISETITEVLVSDLERAATNAAPNTNAELVARVAVLAPSPTIAAIATRLAARPSTDPRSLLRALLYLARTVAEKGGVELSSVEAFSFDHEAVATEALDGQTAALVNWLRIDPAMEEVIATARALQSAPAHLDEIIQAFVTWGGQRTPQERTGVLLALLSPDKPTAPWLSAFRQLDLDESALVDALLELEKHATRREQRKSLATDLCALGPQAPAAQRGSTNFAIALLRRSTPVDFDSALEVIRATGVGRQQKSRLKTAIVRASEATRKKVSAELAAELEAAGVAVPKKHVKQKKSRIPFL